uniref:Amino acid transporter n=1 Tax=Parascaris univalens TaxID=6257 RepID=A0A915A8T3_PARUN
MSRTPKHICRQFFRRIVTMLIVTIIIIINGK